MIGMLVLGLLTRLGLVGGSVDPETMRHALEAWHDFYLLSGTASVTLAMSPAVCLLLATAVWSSWDLLVGVARARRGELGHV